MLFTARCDRGNTFEAKLESRKPEIRNPKLKILQAYDERLAAQTAGIDQRPLTQKAGFRFPERLCRILWLIRFLLRDFVVCQTIFVVYS